MTAIAWGLLLAFVVGWLLMLAFAASLGQAAKRADERMARLWAEWEQAERERGIEE